MKELGLRSQHGEICHNTEKRKQVKKGVCIMILLGKF